MNVMSGLSIGLISVCVVLMIYQYYLISDSKSRFTRDHLELKLKMLSLHPNSHFTFNSLNSIKNLILKEETTQASEYIAAFAQVIRHHQSSGRQVFIPLRKEIEGLLIYADLEKLRFKGSFNFSCHLDHTVDHHKLWIPGYYLQPLIEQLIWNSLDTDNEYPSHLVLSLTMNENTLECSIKVNMFPGDRSSEGQHVNEDLLLNDWLKKRISIFNKLDKEQISIKKIELIDNLNNDKGIEVILRLPVKEDLKNCTHFTIT